MSHWASVMNCTLLTFLLSLTCGLRFLWCLLQQKLFSLPCSSDQSARVWPFFLTPSWKCSVLNLMPSDYAKLHPPHCNHLQILGHSPSLRILNPGPVSFSNVVPVVSQMVTPITNNYTFPCPPLLRWSRPSAPSATDWIVCPQISYAEALPLIWWYLEMGHLGGNQVWMRSWGWSPRMGLVSALIRRHQKACFLSVSMHMRHLSRKVPHFSSPF